MFLKYNTWKSTQNIDVQFNELPKMHTSQEIKYQNIPQAFLMLPPNHYPLPPL